MMGIFPDHYTDDVVQILKLFDNPTYSFILLYNQEHPAVLSVIYRTA
jgi:hypothetical protein